MALANKKRKLHLIPRQPPGQATYAAPILKTTRSSNQLREELLELQKFERDILTIRQLAADAEQEFHKRQIALYRRLNKSQKA
jgi:hypothetical protein